MFGKKKPETESKSGVDYTKLGKSVEEALVKDYIYFVGSTKRQIWGAFLRGVFSGLGGVIGATLVVALLLALLHALGGAPVIGHYFQQAGNNIHSRP